MILESAVLCLALNIYHEARSEMIPGQYAVAQVTMNRAGSQAKVCETVVAKNQFSWTNTMLTKKGKRYILKANGLPKDEHAWDLAKHIATYVLKNRPADFAKGATFYHSTAVAPHWRKHMVKVAKIGRHIFYKQA
jgi:spore germination cell wall hydrolase CwlJ-like protein